MTFSELCRRALSNGNTVEIKLEPHKFDDGEAKIVSAPEEATHLLIRMGYVSKGQSHGYSYYLNKKQIDLARHDLCEHILDSMSDQLR